VQFLEENKTTTATKTPAHQTWTKEKIQEESVNGMVRLMTTTMRAIHEIGPEAVKKLDHAMLEMKVNHYKKLNVKTPIELVKIMAEYEVNVFGSKIAYWGDDKEAHMEYEYCACYNAMLNSECKLSKEEQEGMGKCFAEKMHGLAKAFGWTKAEVKFPTEKTSHITFTK